MTVDTLVAAPVTLPRINLLPQEINQANTARKMKAGLAGVVVLAAAGTGYLYLSANTSVSDAQTQLDAAKSTTSQLQNGIAKHNTVAPIKAAVTSRTDLLHGAMATNVPWAVYLNDVQLNLPRGARLLTWTIAPVPQTAAAAAIGNSIFGASGVATWAITGEAKRYEDVALVIESLQQLKEVDSVFVSTTTTVTDAASGRSIKQFTLTARVKPSAVIAYSLKVGR